MSNNGSSRKVGGANKSLGEAPKSCTRKEHENATNSIAKRGQGAIAPCRVKGQRPLWGLGQRPNSSTGDQYAKGAQQRCRQRSVPASNSALLQERPRAPLSPRFREEPKSKASKRRWTRKKSRSSAFLLHEKGEAADAASPDVIYFSMDSSQESNGLMPSRPATVGATFARPKPWPSFNS